MTEYEAKQELWAWKNGRGAHSNFHALLYTLISKSDPANRERLRTAFPEEVKVWERWQSSEEKEFFMQVETDVDEIRKAGYTEVEGQCWVSPFTGNVVTQSEAVRTLAIRDQALRPSTPGLPSGPDVTE